LIAARNGHFMNTKSKIIPYFVLSLSIAFLVIFSAADTRADSLAGRAAFEKRCGGCHALDRDKEGPRLAGVVGRKAGTVSGFPYSDAVKKSGVVWTEALLDKWLTDPESVVRDSDMAFRLESSVERAAIIAFLKEKSK
jgi:cytochrome c